MTEFGRSILGLVRGALSLLLFAAFGIGAVLLAPVMLVLRTPPRCQPVVRTAWRLAAAAFSAMRLLRLETQGLHRVRGMVLVANHPSLIDVVLLVALVPRTLYVAKRSLRKNPFLAAIVRATALPDDATLPRKAAAYLKDGWNILVFPEGTRSPRTGGLGAFHRGAAQLALRTHVPVSCVRIDVSRRLLAKGQRAWDVGAERVTYAFRSSEIDPPRRTNLTALRSAAIALTEEMRRRLDRRND